MPPEEIGVEGDASTCLDISSTWKFPLPLLREVLGFAATLIITRGRCDI